MFSWIERLLNRDHDHTEYVCVKRLQKDCLEVQVLVYPLKDGTAAYLVDVFSLDPDECLPPERLAWFNDFDIGVVSELFKDARQFIDTEKASFKRLAVMDD